jgi:hypothetical protein
MDEKIKRSTGFCLFKKNTHTHAHSKNSKKESHQAGVVPATPAALVVHKVEGCG